jgi:hypothetical protein
MMTAATSPAARRSRTGAMSFPAPGGGGRRDRAATEIGVRAPYAGSRRRAPPAFVASLREKTRRAVAGRADVLAFLATKADPEENRRAKIAHPGTFNANPLTAAAGVAMLSAVADGQARSVKGRPQIRSGPYLSARSRKQSQMA